MGGDVKKVELTTDEISQLLELSQRGYAEGFYYKGYKGMSSPGEKEFLSAYSKLAKKINVEEKP